jgi:hypothetical protein
MSPPRRIDIAPLLRFERNDRANGAVLVYVLLAQQIAVEVAQ